MNQQAIEFIGNGQCHICGYPITIIETESSDIKLNPEGVPIDFTTANYDIYGICKKCGQMYYDIEKTSVGFKIKNRLKELIPSLQISDYNELNPFGFRR